MVHHSSNSPPSSADADADADGLLFPTLAAGAGPAAVPAQFAGHLAAVAKSRVRTRAIGQVVVLAVDGPLDEVVEDLGWAIQVALAEGPRAVICDLLAVPEGEGSGPGAVDALAAAGGHVRDWAGIPVAVVCSEARVRAALSAHSVGGHLIVKASMLQAVSAVLTTPLPAVGWLRLAPHPTAPRASRNFVTRTLLDWGVGGLIPSACLVVSELVTNSTIHAETDIAVSVAWNLGALRVTVRDDSPDLPRRRNAKLDVSGRGLSLIANLSTSFGVLPTAEGGKVVWAVLNAERARPPARTAPSQPATSAQGPTTSTVSILRQATHPEQRSRAVPRRPAAHREPAIPEGEAVSRAAEPALLNPALLNPAEVAALFGVDARTVTRWANTGKLTALRTLGGHRRYRESEIRALLRRRGTES